MNQIVDPAEVAEASLRLEPFEHDDGIYFGLDETAYHADRALGSSDMGRLYYSPEEYWFQSRYNPLREPDDTKSPARVRGSAVHCFVLYGQEEFLARYAPTIHPGNTTDGKKELREIQAIGKRPLKFADYARIMQSGAMIRQNPHIATAFSGGAAEVSVFWTVDGIRKKARFDYLKPRGVVDLKSITNRKRIGFVDACRRSICEWNYPLQAAHYLEARAALPTLWVKQGLPEHDTLLANCQSAKEWAWVWVFWQAESAPLTWAGSLSPGNPILDAARVMLERALDNFKTFRDRHGLDGEPWVHPEPVGEVDITELPAWWGR